MTQRYLGDGVYVDHDARGLVLTTETYGATHTIILEVETLANLLIYLGIDWRLAWPGTPANYDPA